MCVVCWELGVQLLKAVYFVLLSFSTPTEISACKQNETLSRLLGSSSLNVDSPRVKSLVASGAKKMALRANDN